MKYLRSALFDRFANNRLDDSMATRLRRKRFELFLSQISHYSGPIKILDVGGTELFWETMGFTQRSSVHIVLLNISEIKTKYHNFSCVVADARKMPFKKNKEFDIVFSNSAIEHMGSYGQQMKVAQEIKRVGKSFFIQTPNKYFPIEPHGVFPLFQFMPLKLRKMIVACFHPGWYKKSRDEKFDEHTINSVRLLTEMELKTLFFPCRIYKEKLFGLTKSLIALSER